MKTTYVVYIDCPRRVVAFGENRKEVIAYAERHYSEEVYCLQLGIACEQLAERLRKNPGGMDTIRPVIVGKQRNLWVLGTEEDMKELLKEWDIEKEEAPFSWCIYQEGYGILASGKTMAECFDDYMRHDKRMQDYEEILVEILEGRMQVGLITPALAKEIENSGGDVPWSELGTFSGFPVLGTDEEYEEREGPMEI